MEGKGGQIEGGRGGRGGEEEKGESRGGKEKEKGPHLLTKILDRHWAYVTCRLKSYSIVTMSVSCTIYETFSVK